MASPINSSTTAAARLGVLDHGGIALAYAVALIVSPIAALLAIGTVTFVIVSDGRRRRRDFASLLMTGFPLPRSDARMSLKTRSCSVLRWCSEPWSDIVSDTLALSSLPQFVSGSGGFPISRAAPIVPLLCAVGILGLLLAGVVEVSTRLAMHGSRSRQDSGASE